MTFQKPFLRCLTVFFICLFFIQNAVCDDNPDLREKTRQFYYELLMMNSTGDPTPVVPFLDPEVVIIHQGPESAFAPFYNRYEPIPGVPYSAFITTPGQGHPNGWANDLTLGTVITTLIPEYTYQFGKVGVPDLDRYMTVEENVVYSNILVGGNVFEWDISDLENPISVKGTEWAMDSLHIISYNDKGLIDKLIFISQTETFMKAVDGIPSTLNDLIYSQAMKINVTDYTFSPCYNKGLGALFVSKMKQGREIGLGLMLADDVICQIPGSARFSGEFIGKNEVKNFIDIISKELISVPITQMVGEGNCARIKCKMTGKNSQTGKIFSSEETVFSFQFNKEGKIVSIFCNYDTYSVAAAYK